MFISRIAATSVLGWLVLFMGWNSVDVFAVTATTESTVLTTLQPKTKFYMEIRITNRIFNDTLENQESAEYKTLRQEVDELFLEVYSPTPLEYVRTDEITFRNGSVIVGAELLFGTIMINPVLERALFIARYQQLQSPKLAIDLNFVANELPTQQPVVDTTTTLTPATTPSTSTHLQTHSTSLGSSTVNTTTLHPDTNTTHSPMNITVTDSTTTVSPNATLSPSNHNITSSIPTSSFVSTASPSTPAAGVPGWGIALLVLAAISLLFLIILLIILLVMCCCWPNKRTVVKEPALAVPMYYSPEIPMYSTHSIDAANGKQADVREKPPKNRTGMYVVNK